MGRDLLGLKYRGDRLGGASATELQERNPGILFFHHAAQRFGRSAARRETVAEGLSWPLPGGYHGWSTPRRVRCSGLLAGRAHGIVEEDDLCLSGTYPDIA